MKCLTIVAVSLCLSNCGASPVAPAAVHPPTLVCAGQSNAVQTCTVLARMTPTIGYAQGGVPIVCFAPSGDCWDAFRRNLVARTFTTTDPDFFVPAAPGTTTLDALVWFQGESDGPHCDGVADLDGGLAPTDPIAFVQCSGLAYSAYVNAFRALIARVRADTGQPTLRVIAVEIGSYYRYAPVQQAQQDVLASDVNGRYVRTSDLRFSGHPLPEQYPIIAQRVLDAVR